MTSELLATPNEENIDSSEFYTSSRSPSHSIGLDDTFILMSSSDFESEPILIRQEPLRQNVLNDHAQPQTKLVVVETLKNVDHDPRPSTSTSGRGTVDAPANNPVEIGGNGVNPIGQGGGEEQSVGGIGGGAAGSGQPPDGGGGDGSGIGLGIAEADDSHEQQSGESTTTSGSMPELVAPPPDPFLIPLLYPTAPLPSSPDVPLIEGDHSDESRASEATTAPMVSDNETQQQQGVHIIAVTNTSSTSTSSTNTALSSVSSSSLLVVKQPSEYLDTTLSSMSPFTSTSSSSTKAQKAKSMSDSSGHLNVSKHEKSLDVSKGSTESSECVGDLSSQDMFGGHNEFLVSTPARGATATVVASSIRRRFDDAEAQFEESEDSEFIVPPSLPEPSVAPSSPTDMVMVSAYDNTEKGNAAVSDQQTISRHLTSVDASETEKKARKRPVLELTLDKNPHSSDDLQLVRPSRRAVAEMAAKATIGDFLIKSMQNVSEVVSDEALSHEVDIAPVAAAGSLRKRQGFPLEDAGPSAKVIRKIAFESQTSSDESVLPSTMKTVASNVPELSSVQICAKPRTMDKLCDPFLESPDDSSSGKEHSEKAVGASSGRDSAIADSQALQMSVVDTEEDEAAVEDLILRYSPSQTAESQYFPLVPESFPSDSEQTSKFSQAKLGLRLGTVCSLLTADGSTQSDVLPSFNLQRPCSETPSALDSERINRPVEFDLRKVKAVPEEQPKRLVLDESLSDEENPFESYTPKTNPKKTEIDEPDTPVCPVGRHKRKVVWLQSCEDETESVSTSSKRKKSESKSVGCQVDIGRDSLDTVTKREDEGDAGPSIAKDQSIQTSANGDTNLAEGRGGDEKDGEEVIIRQTVVVKRFVSKEVLVCNKVIAKKQYEEEDEPIVKEYSGGRGFSVTDFESFTRPTPADKITPEGSGSSKSTSILSLKSSSPSSSGVLGDISSLSKSSSSSKKDSIEDLTTEGRHTSGNKVCIDMRTLRSVRRRKCFEARKSLNLSESDSTPERCVQKDSDDLTTPASTVQAPAKKRGRPKLIVSRDNAKPKIKCADKTVEREIGELPIAGPSTSTALSGEPQSSDRGQGIRVMAKWRDGYYYPGIIIENENDNKVKVRYEDGDIRSIKGSDVLTVSVLPVGQSVYVMSPDGYYDSSIVTDSYDDNGSIGYVVATDGGAVRRVPREAVILTADQAACMENIACTPPPRTVASISLDNLVEGKRHNRGFSLRTSTSPQTARSSRTPRQTRRITMEESASLVELCDEAVSSAAALSSGKSEGSTKSETGKLRKSK